MYLGVPFSENLNIRKAKINFFKRAEMAINDLRGRIYKSRIFNSDSKMALYNSLVRSILMYCAPVWGLEFRNEFEKLRMKFLKCLLSVCLKKSKINYVIYAERPRKTFSIYLSNVVIMLVHAGNT